MLSFSASRSVGPVVTERDKVEARLADLGSGLSIELLQEANLQGYRHRLEAGPAHAITAPGTYHWHETVPALTTRLEMAGWKRLNINGCPIMQSPDRTVALFVMTGDAKTGQELGRPSNQSAKGAVMEGAIYQEREMAAAAREVFDQGDGTQPWVYLYHAELGINGVREIRSEVSRPSEFRGRKIRDWSERLVLPAIRPNDDIDIPFGQPDTGPVDVPVQRKTAS